MNFLFQLWNAWRWVRDCPRLGFRRIPAPAYFGLVLLFGFGCGSEEKKETVGWRVQLELPQVVLKSTERTQRFHQKAGKLRVTMRKGPWVRCEEEMDFGLQPPPSLRSCDMSRTDPSGYEISAVLRERGGRRILGHAKARFRPMDFPSEDTLTLRLTLDISVKELDPPPEKSQR